MAALAIIEYVGVFYGILDFDFQGLMKQQVAHARKFPSAPAIQRKLDAHYLSFPSETCLPSFLDNHDMDRFLFEARDNKARLRQAAEIQFRQTQPPIIYYGTEAGMPQSKPLQGPYGDVVARQMMPWKNPDRAMFEFYQKIIRTRKQRQRAMAKNTADE